MRVFSSLSDFADAVGEELGTTDWIAVDQTRINRFAGGDR